MEQTKMRLKHFSCRSCEKVGQSWTVTALRTHGQAIDTPAERRRVRFADLCHGRDWPVLAIEPRQSGDGRSKGRGPRFLLRGSACARRGGSRLRSHEFCAEATPLQSPGPLGPLSGWRADRTGTVRTTTLPEKTAMHSKTKVHDVQNRWAPSPARVQSLAFLAETAVIHSKAALLNLHNSSPQARCGAQTYQKSRAFGRSQSPRLL